MEKNQQQQQQHGLYHRSQLSSSKEKFKDKRIISGKRLGSKGEPKSELLMSNPNLELYNLNIANLQNDESTIASLLKVDLFQIQDQINKLDFDNKIRKGVQTEFFKFYFFFFQKKI